MANSDYTYSFSSSHGRLKLNKKLNPSVKAEREAAAKAQAEAQAKETARVENIVNTAMKPTATTSTPIENYGQQAENKQNGQMYEDAVSEAMSKQNQQPMRGLLGDYQLGEDDIFTAFRKRKNF